MSRILVLGGYGGFGARLSRRLVAAGHHVLVAGRSRGKAAKFCAKLPGAEPVVADRCRDLQLLLSELRPDILIDAAGPFQDGSYGVPSACIAAGVHYLDLADARQFVCGIAALDRDARRASVCVISGASSVPALSGAVARHLSEGMDRVSQVEIAISASTRSTASHSVTGAILTYAGRRISLWRAGRWSTGFGGSELRRMKFEVTGARPLRRRWLALCDVPDLELMPGALPGTPTVVFRAGSDRPPQILGLWLVSWMVRFGLLRSLAGFTNIFVWLQRAVLWVGSDRSAMAITLCGWRAHQGIERRWTLIAEDGSGPEVPTLAAILLVERLLSGRIETGARDASEVLTLDDFGPLLADLPISHGTSERMLEPPLYRRAMGERFDHLPPLVRLIHEVGGDAGAAGRGTVAWGGSRVAALICRLMRFPPPGEHELHVAFAQRNGGERWTRDFGGHQFSSVLQQSDCGVSERFGPIRFHFELPSDAEGLRMVLRRWSLFGVPLPPAVAPRIEAREREEADRFLFHVDVAMPLVGRVIRYSGWLEHVAQRKKAAGRTRPPLDVTEAAA